MEINARISQLNKEALKRIEEAAKQGDTKSILANTKIVEETERLVKRLEGINASLDALEKRAKSPSELDEISNQSAVRTLHTTNEIAEEISPRMKGEIRRRKFIHDLQAIGINLIHKSGSLYKTSMNGLVGIAYASERQPNRWFLGLPLKDYDCVALLCENEAGEMLNFILPGDFYRSHKANFSQSGGQLKFNIALRGGKYHLTIPDVGNVVLNQFQDNYDSLRL